MKIYLAALAVCLSANICVSAQDYIESFSHNKDFRGVDRVLQYTPDPNGYIVSENGQNLYTRALYGGPSLWRLETSDRPIFAAYHKKDNRNIRFEVTADGITTPIDSTAKCTALYKGGERIYRLSDPAWGKGHITLTALASQGSESAVWKITATDMPHDAIVRAIISPTVKIKINRSGDMGADPANCFAPDPEAKPEDIIQKEIPLYQANIKKNKKNKKSSEPQTIYFGYADRDFPALSQTELAALYDVADAEKEALTGRITIDTPDPYLNTMATSLLAAADGIWDGLTYQHGAIGWRMPLSGWRGAYTGDFLGWHDRARTHFDAYAASQVTDVPPTMPHPAQDPDMNGARALKQWGTQMYSNGYICRNPQKNNVMHHYDMNLCYIDELMRHLQWTGDMEYAEKMWPVIESSLAWEKRNYDPDNDGLYDAYCCIWASDALYYNSGAVTHSTAYNYYANLMAAALAQRLGKDASIYENEANKILSAMNSTLWVDDKGVWAEFRDFMGNRQMHTHPGLWTVYHAIDSHTATPEQAYSATVYVDHNIPHIPVLARGLDDTSLEVISTTDWLPYAWSINNVAFAEIYHMALAYWQAGRPEQAYKLLKSAVLDGMYIGNSPGNIGQISHYDAARGECYRDFADPVGVLSRTLVEGLFGFSPDAIHNNVDIRPGMPADWDHASITHPDFALDFQRQGSVDAYDIKLQMPATAAISTASFILPLRYPKVNITADGKPVDFTIYDEGTPYATVRFSLPANNTSAFKIAVNNMGDRLTYTDTGMRYADIPEVLGTEIPAHTACQTIDLTGAYNANVTDIFRNTYASPRSPYTTLQLPLQGIGEWCHPKDTANIDDSYLRGCNGSLKAPGNLTFATPADGHNAAFVSLYDNYPDSLSIPISGKASAIALLMAGSTNHMQCYGTNATVKAVYTDGSYTEMPLVPPYNWCPIEQDYFTDGKAFVIPTDRPYRVALKTGETDRDLGNALNIDGVYGRRIDGGAATILTLPVDPEKKLDRITLTAQANEVVVGILAASLLSGSTPENGATH